MLKIYSILVLLAGLALAGYSYRFDEGYLEDYPLDTKDEDILITVNGVQWAKPERKISVVGTLQSDYISDFWSAGGEMEFQINYREGSDEGYERSLVLEFSVPFARNESYQNREIIYSEGQEDPRYHLDKRDLKVFRVDQDFFVLRGKEIADGVSFRAFYTQILVRTVTSGSSIDETETDVIDIGAFELVFEMRSKVHRLKIIGRKENHSWMTRDSVEIILVAIIFLFEFLIQNMLTSWIAKILKENREEFQFQASFVTMFCWPFYLVILFAYSTGVSWVAYLIFVIFVLCIKNLNSYYHLINVVQKRAMGKLTFQFPIVMTILNLSWIAVLYFQPWLLLHSFVFYSFVLVFIDLVLLFFTSSLRFHQVLATAGMAALRGLLAEMVILAFYVFVFYEAHGELPSRGKWFLAVNLVLFLVLMGISGIIALVVGRKNNGSGYSKELMENSHEIEQ